jgi:hypothetical protein
MLVIYARRASLVSLHWDLGKVGGRVLMFLTYVLAGTLGICGLYTVVRLVKLLGAR